MGRVAAQELEVFMARVAVQFILYQGSYFLLVIIIEGDDTRNHGKLNQIFQYHKFLQLFGAIYV